jgi:hypothetical protein
MHLSTQVRREKLAKLLAAAGLSDVTELFKVSLFGNRPTPGRRGSVPIHLQRSHSTAGH